MKMVHIDFGGEVAYAEVRHTSRSGESLVYLLDKDGFKVNSFEGSASAVLEEFHRWSIIYGKSIAIRPKDKKPRQLPLGERK